MSAETPTRTPPSLTIPEVLPILPLRDAVVYPYAIVPLAVAQPRSVQLVDDAMRAERLLGLVAIRHPEAQPPGPDDLYRVGTVALAQQLQRSADGSLQLVVQGIERVRLKDFVQTEPYLAARVAVEPVQLEEDIEVEALGRALRELFRRLVSLAEELPDELVVSAERVSDLRQLAYLVAATVRLEVSARQEVLEAGTVGAMLRRLIELLQRELAVRELGQRIRAQTKEQLTRAQRQFYLREQLRAIQRELGEEPEQAQLREIRERLQEMNLPDEARREAERELDRLETLPAASPEYGIIRTYLEWMLSLPWNRPTGELVDVEQARRILDEDHYDLERVKERILEYLAVRRLRQERREAAPEAERAPILCFVGAPGVGKTSLGQSIARAMRRRFVRISLGGVHDEAEIRGHRRTYVGAMPGRIIQAMRRAGTSDPVFMLDEVDKLGVGFHGDPAAALLEVLDPAQNNAFSDAYLGVPFDLSRVVFICTANSAETIPPALLDRMEVLRLAGYTAEEKVHIARRFLVARQLQANALHHDEVVLSDDAIRRIIREYTREAGVRSLERDIAAIFRKVARRIAEGAPTPIAVDASQVPDYLGKPRFFEEAAERTERPGVATGLAWTPTGGEVLFVEATMMPSREERLLLTGMLGDVMRESAQTALSYLRSEAARFRVDPTVFEGKTIHVHVPAGAIPKDGPSAGVTILVALASLASRRPVHPGVGLTGEITLRGRVLPVGGIKEKVLAANRAGLGTVVLPRRNEADLDDVPAELRQQMNIVLIDSVEDALFHALGLTALARAA